MRRRLFHVLCAAAFLAAAPAIAAADDWTGTVKKIVDGDTVWVEREDLALKVRLRWVDAPEKHQPHGRESAQYLERLLLDKKVTVRQAGTSYTRAVGEVLVDGRSVNAGVAKWGHGWTDPRYKPPARLVELEREALEKRRGLWAADNPIPPWDWRKGKR